MTTNKSVSRCCGAWARPVYSIIPLKDATGENWQYEYHECQKCKQSCEISDAQKPINRGKPEVSDGVDE